MAAKPVAEPFAFTPRNERQRIAWERFPEVDVLFLLGPAGTGKTHLAMMLAVGELAKAKGKTKIYVSRPCVEAGAKIGYLPGTIDEKMAPFMTPITEILGRTKQAPKAVERVENASLSHLRGRTFRDCVAVLDEAQNATEGELKLFLTRLGENAKMIVAGDDLQADIRDCPLYDVAMSLGKLREVAVVDFLPEDVVRSKVVTKILAAWPE